MFQDDIQDITTALDQPPQPLCGAMLFLLKAADSDTPDGPMKFMGIASDESEDVEGDKILKKNVDLSYAKARGYVNWDHSREPGNQLGFLTKAEIVDGDNVGKLRKDLGLPISSSASVFVEGEFYKHVPKAMEVFNIMKSTPVGQPGLGLSLDGAMARDLTSGGIVRAFVRGVAITPVPAHPKTLMRLKKSLQGYELFREAGAMPEDLPAAIASEVVAELKKSMGPAEHPKMSLDQAALWILKKKPEWTYNFAQKVVRYSMLKTKRS